MFFGIEGTSIAGWFLSLFSVNDIPNSVLSDTSPGLQPDRSIKDRESSQITFKKTP